MTLTEERAESIRGEPESPHEIFDPATKRRYVLIAAEVFAKLKEEADDARFAEGWLKATQHGMSLALNEEIS